MMCPQCNAEKPWTSDRCPNCNQNIGIGFGLVWNFFRVVLTLFLFFWFLSLFA